MSGLVPAITKRPSACSLICATKRVSPALVRAEPTGGGVIQALGYPVAERRTRRRRIALGRRRVHLRHHRNLDLRRWRRCGDWRVKLRAARRNNLRRSGVCDQDRGYQGAEDDRCVFHKAYVVIALASRKQPTANKLFFRCVLDRVEPVGFETEQVP